MATLTGVPGHEMVEQALTVLRNLEHRGATGSEPDSGDGAGILLQIPDAFLREVSGFELPEAGSYAVGIAFLPADNPDEAVSRIETIAAEEGIDVLGWREVPVAPQMLGAIARSTMPVFRQLFVSATTDTSSDTGPGPRTGIALDRKTFVLRKRAEREAGIYFPSLSARTIVYKGMLTTGQLEPFFPDLSDRRFATRSPSCTRASPPTPSRAGRSPTRTASSPTTARSTRSRATATGCAPASPSWPPTCSVTTPARWSGPSRSAPPTPPTRRPSTRSWSCSTSAAVRCRTPC